MTAEDRALLAVSETVRHFGSVRAVDGVTMVIEEAEIRGLIGPNGAGKTTLVNVVTGFVPASSGTVRLAGQRLDGFPPHRRVRSGLGRTFQTPQLSSDMTVRENLLVGAHHRFACSRFRDVGRLLHMRERMRGTRDRVEGIAEVLGLGETLDVPAGSLSYGPLRVVEIGRALMTEPKIIMLDEPVAGMNMAESAHLAGIIRRLRDDGVSVVLIEHDMSFVMELCDRITVLDQGRVLLEDTPEAVQRNSEVAEVYLGTTSGNGEPV